MRKLMWLTVGVGLACVWGGYFACRYGAVIAVLAAVAAAALFLLSGKKRCLKAAALVCSGVAVGLVWFLGFEKLAVENAAKLDGQTVQLSVRAGEYAQETEYGVRFLGETEISGREHKVLTYLYDLSEPVSPADVVEGRFLLRTTVAEETGDSTYHQGNGIYLVAYPRGEVTVILGQPDWKRDLPAMLRQSVLTLLEEVFPEDTAPVAKALLLGDSSDLTYEVDTDLKIAGIRHVIAVSGMHVSILFSALYLLSGRKRLLTALLGIPAMVLFAAAAGFSPSVTRSCIMQILMMLSLLFEREYDPPTALSFAALVMMAVNPLVITSVSFQLSVGCMAGIFAFSGPIRRRLYSGSGKDLRSRLKRWAAESLSITLGAMSLTTPLCAWYFGTVSLIGIVTNLLTLWLIAHLFNGILLVCVVGSFWFAGAQGIAWVISWGIRAVLWLCGVLADFPLAAVYTKSIYVVFWLIFAYLLIFGAALVRKMRPVVISCLLALSLCLSVTLSWVTPPGEECRVTVLDVGQGQCILLQAGGRSYLVDCGGRGERGTADEAAHTLMARGIRRLDGLILTHYDADHAAGAVNLLAWIEVDCLLLPGIEDETGRGAALASGNSGETLTVETKTELAFDGGKLTLYPSVLQNSGNESSMCVLFQTENCGILITGDRGSLGEGMLLRTAQLPDVDVLVVGHHGAADAASQALLETVKPEMAIISVGKNNPYGHPAQETLQRLTEFGCQVYRTDLHGTITYRR